MHRTRFREDPANSPGRPAGTILRGTGIQLPGEPAKNRLPTCSGGTFDRSGELIVVGGVGPWFRLERAEPSIRSGTGCQFIPHMPLMQAGAPQRFSAGVAQVSVAELADWAEKVE